ncbi:MAG: TIGR03790 family protein [Verrucomicrobiota bacterium]
MKRILLAAGFLAGGMFFARAESGEAVVVVYNSSLPESKEVAQYYAGRRKVPENQVVGFALPKEESMSRAEFRNDLEKPLLKYLESKKIFVFHPNLDRATNDTALWKLDDTKVRYLVLCYGVPARIRRDESLVENGMEKLRAELRRNEAAVDSELALLPLHNPKRMLAGPAGNPFYKTTNSAALHPTNGILMVARLDGPGAAIAKGLVDKAMEAETNGLWGRSYFDLRGVTNEYKSGDDWMRTAAEVNYKFGYETIIDEKPETFPADFPMSQIAFYAGWYDSSVSGPFTQPKVEFMPGAFAYHLHSYSANVIRSTTANWVGPLLAKGATITMGAVDEPYLLGTPDVGVFFASFMFGKFSFGEAAYASQQTLSWQITVIGDPLYRPFVRPPQEVHQDLLTRGSDLIEWSHLRVVDLNIAKGFPMTEVVRYLETQPVTKKSAVLLEKLGDLYFAQGKPASANQCYKDALKLEVTPLEKVRLEKWVSNTTEAAAKSLKEK